MRYLTVKQVLARQRAARRASVLSSIVLLLTAPPLIALGFGVWWLVGYAMDWTQGELALEVGLEWYVGLPVAAGGFPALELAVRAHDRFGPPGPD